MLYSFMGVCCTVGLLVTIDTVTYSDCSLDATWTRGNNGAQVGTNTRHLPPFDVRAVVFVTHVLLILNDK
jgi:hypothetical protein